MSRRCCSNSCSPRRDCCCQNNCCNNGFGNNCFGNNSNFGCGGGCSPIIWLLLLGCW